MNNVKLISHSMPSTEFVGMGIEDCRDLIAFCASAIPARYSNWNYVIIDDIRISIRW